MRGRTYLENSTLRNLHGARTMEKPDYFQANGLLTVGEGESETVSLNCSGITLLFPRIYLFIAVIIYKQFFFYNARLFCVFFFTLLCWKLIFITASVN